MSDNLIDLTQVYKVVSRPYHDCLPRSAFVRTRFTVVYKEGRFAYPSIGYLMAFDTLEHALSVIRNVEHEIWIATAQIVPFYNDWLPQPNSSVGLIESFWHNPNRSRMYGSLIVPEGTVFCKSLRLDRRVR